jgi:ATP-binding cassette subfamily C protein LapB
MYKFEHNENQDELLECLVLYTKLYHKPFSAESLVAGLPVSNSDGKVELFSLKSSKALFSRAAKRAGLNSKLVKKELENISPLVLPIILVLKDRKACILESIDRKNNKAKIIMPETEETENVVSLTDLNEQYLGYAFYIKKNYEYKVRTDRVLQNRTKHWFWGTLKLSWGIYKDVIIASLLINLFLVASPLFTMNVYDRVVPNSAFDTLWILAIGISVVYLIDITIKFTRTYFLEMAAKKSDIIMSSMIFEKVLDLKMANKPKSVGSFANNIKEFDHIRNFFNTSTIAAFIDIPFAVIFIIVIYFIGGNIIVIPLSIMFIVLIYVLVVRGPLYQSILATNEAQANKNGVLIETLVNLETIKTMNYTGRTQWNWEEATGEIANKSIKSKLISASIPVVTQFFVQLNTIAIIVYGVYLISDKEMTMGALIATVMLSSRAISPLSQVSGLLSNFEQTKASYENLENIMKMPVERENNKQFVERPPFSGKIEFNNVTFTYPDEQKPALENVSFVINPKEKAAIIGKIGSGKSTIVKLLLGLYEPDSGEILVDGIDINQIDPADIRRNISYVAQDIILFRGTLKDNILVRAPHANDASILKASKISCVDEFVNRHPLGFDMEVGERGEGLSGGQRQSVSIARSFLIESPIMLFDEPTNMMDSTTETRVKGNIKKNIQGKTLLLVTHKNSLLDMVDRVLVMHQGKLVMDGDKMSVVKKLQGK